MKKTNSMRVAVAMLALTLITSCFVGGTFAKYTTSAKGEDVARVAKFGVKIDATSSAFSKQYESDTESYAGLTVESDNKVVAPGTSGTIDLFKISGTPEVAVKIEAKVESLSQVWLHPIKSFNVPVSFMVTVTGYQKDPSYHETIIPSGNNQGLPGLDVDVYDPEPTPTREVSSSEAPSRPTGDAFDGVNYNDYYYPITWSLIKGEDAENPVATGSIDEIQAYIDEEISGTYAPGTDLSTIAGSYKLMWSWSFEGNDEYDTVLGNIAAGDLGIYAEGEYNLNESFKFTITVTQID